MPDDKMFIKFYPVGNADSAIIKDDDGKFLMIDYCCSKEAADDDDERINLEEELDDLLGDNDLDVLAFSHAHEDHYLGFSEYFWLDSSKKHQGKDRRKFNELWVPDSVIWEIGVEDEEKLLRGEARYRFLDAKEGIKVIGESDSLKDYIKKSGKATYDEVKHLIIKPGEIISDFESIEIFIHSPHSWKTDNDENKNNRCIVLHLDFLINGASAATAIFGGDAESDAWESIYSSSKNNDNLDRIDFDIFKLSHHCSHTALNKKEKGEFRTEPVPKVKAIFEDHGQDKCILVATCSKIPSRENRNEQGPPHYQAAEYYRKVAKDKSGKFNVTMEQPWGRTSLKPIIVEITKYGPRINELAGAISGADVITSKKSEKHG